MKSIFNRHMLSYSSIRILIVTGIIFIAASALIILYFLQYGRTVALKEAEAKALIILNRNLATHTYFNQKLKPSLFSWTEPFRKPEYFDPVWMSSTYAIREIERIYQALNKEGYYYKECAINARSPLNEADDFEKEFLLKLNNDPKLEKTSGVRMIEGKPFFYVLRRGEIMEASCLRCHSDPAKAPGGLVASYGSERSFQRKVGDTVSAISIRIPLEVAYANVNRFVLQVSGVMVVILMTLLAGQLWFLSRFIFSPLALMHNKALQIAASREHLGEEIVVPSGIELSDLAKSFNRMSAALRENMDLIEDRVKERTAELAEANQSLMTEITERKQVEAELKDALTKVKLLSGMLPICSSCKKIRDDKGYWEEVADYITEHSEVLFSHGLCPDCEKKAFAELEKLKREDGP